MKQTDVERLKAIAEKIAGRESKRAAVLEKHKPKDGKALTTAQRLSRIEEYLGIADE